MARTLYSGVSEQSKAGKHRRDDAHALFAACRWRGAMYLAGYSIECLLKARLMQRYGCRQLRDLERQSRSRGLLSELATVFDHRREVLFALTGALDRLKANRELWGRFRVMNQWIPAWRYSADLSNEKDAQRFLDAVGQMIHWIEANT